MTPRLNSFAAAPAPMKAWLDYSQTTLKNGLEESLMELVKIRASQINGCAFCLDMHTAAARKRGETEQRLYLLDAWRESPLYSARARRSGVDRGADEAARNRRAGRGLSRAERAVQRGGAGCVDARDRRDQRLEPD